MFKLLAILVIFAGVAYGQSPNCTDYCTTFLANCNSGTWMTYYADMTECMAVCAAFPVGTFADRTTNTLGCRLYHAQASPANYTLHCPHASATGGNYCGTYCEAYCNMSLFQCNANNGYYVMGTPNFNNYATCSKVCALYPQGDIFNDRTVNTLGCRIYHAKAAIATSDPAHCTHASPSGGDYCGSFCEAYCTLINGSCAVGANKPQYASNTACDDYCSNNLHDNTPSLDGHWNDTSGDTTGCRIYHSTAFLATGDSSHCLHAGPSGDNTCGSWCTVYCDLIQNACYGSNAQYTSTAQCMDVCGNFSSGGAPGDASGNTVQCRIYHAGVAGSDITNNAHVHCPHAGPSGGGVCVATTTGAATGAATTGAATSVVVSVLLVAAMMILAVIF